MGTGEALMIAVRTSSRLTPLTDYQKHSHNTFGDILFDCLDLESVLPGIILEQSALANGAQTMGGMRNDKDLNHILKKTEKEFGLPPHKIIFHETGEENGWASAYGGIIELANYAKIKKFLSCPFNAMWQHGIIPEQVYRAIPQVLTYGLIENLEQRILVANDDQKECLERFGFKNVHAIGTPFAYAKPIILPKRKPGTILWMPTHTTPDEPEDWSKTIQQAVSWFAKKYRDSSKNDLYACLHNECIKGGLWWPELLKDGIPVIRGGSHHDGNCYKRMWLLLSQIDIVSTNTYGSHIFYALAAGCKVRIEGPLFEPDIDTNRLAALPYYQRLVSQGVQLEHAILYHIRHTATFKELLGEESCNRHLGEEMIGIHKRLSPSNIRKLLGWSTRAQLASTAKHSIRFIARITSNSTKAWLARFGLLK